MNNLMEAAPILIPTCNRISHLKDLINSIKKNEGVQNTELYISVDYPPSKKYENGYAEVVDDCESLKYDDSFKKVHLFIQENIKE